jgi:hypothetical protein
MDFAVGQMRGVKDMVQQEWLDFVGVPAFMWHVLGQDLICGVIENET